MRSLEEAKRQLLQSLRKEIGDDRVLEAMEKVPRELFVPAAVQHLAYEDIPLPIGEGQTISQPLIVALMSSALELKKSDKVLELGTGSGYQAAILGLLAAKVITMERIPSLADTARTLLSSLGYTNIQVRLSKGALGCPEEAPFDAIIVTAGAPKLPSSLLDQLVTGGRMVIPVGSREQQQLMKVVKTAASSYYVKTLGPCRFVPLIGEEAWEEEPPG